MHLYFLLFPSVWHSGDRLEMPKADSFIDTINGGIDKQLLLNTSNRRFIIWVILARVMGRHPQILGILAAMNPLTNCGVCQGQHRSDFSLTGYYFSVIFVKLPLRRVG